MFRKHKATCHMPSFSPRRSRPIKAHEVCWKLSTSKSKYSTTILNKNNLCVAVAPFLGLVFKQVSRAQGGVEADDISPLHLFQAVQSHPPVTHQRTALDDGVFGHQIWCLGVFCHFVGVTCGVKFEDLNKIPTGNIPVAILFGIWPFMMSYDHLWPFNCGTFPIIWQNYPGWPRSSDLKWPWPTATGQKARWCSCCKRPRWAEVSVRKCLPANSWGLRKEVTERVMVEQKVPKINK